MKIRIPFLLGMVLLIGVLAVAGDFIYAANHAHAAGGPPPAAGQAIPVTVQTVQPQSVRVWSEFSGRLMAVDSAEIRPQVGGIITEVRIHDGQNVKTGDVLFVIDPRPFEAAEAKAEANLAGARTNAEFAQTDLARADDLIKSQAIAQRMYDQRVSDEKTAAANVQGADAALRQAKLDLEHAYVRAPIAGRISRAEITVGNLVQTTPNAPLLTTIISNDGIYADFDVDEQTYLANIRASAGDKNQEHTIPVELVVGGDRDHVYKGTIYSFDNQINASTGTIRARAKFANEDGALIPGMSVSVRLSGNNETQAIVVSERAIGTDQSKKYLFVVSPQNKVEYREVTLGPDVARGRIVLTGLAPGERVIVDGVQHVKPDAVVDAKEAAPDAAKDGAK